MSVSLLEGPQQVPKMYIDPSNVENGDMAPGRTSGTTNKMGFIDGAEANDQSDPQGTWQDNHRNVPCSKLGCNHNEEGTTLDLEQKKAKKKTSATCKDKENNADDMNAKGKNTTGVTTKKGTARKTSLNLEFRLQGGPTGSTTSGPHDGVVQARRTNALTMTAALTDTDVTLGDQRGGSSIVSDARVGAGTWNRKKT